MKRLFYLLFGLVLLPALLYAQGSLSLKDINDNLTNNYYNKTVSDGKYAVTADLDSAEAAINALNISNDSQDVQIESNRVAITLKASQTDMDSAEAVIQNILVDDDSQDVTIEANKVGVASLEVGLQTHQNNPTGAHAATAISTTTWDNVQTCLDSLETAIAGIITGTGFATAAQVSQEVLVHNADAAAHSTKFGNYYTAAQTNATIENAISSLGDGNIQTIYADDDPTGSSGPNVTLKAGENVTITRTGDTFEIASTGGGSSTTTTTYSAWTNLGLTYNRTDNDTFTVADSTTATVYLKKGLPLKYTISGTNYYAIITNVVSAAGITTVDLAGAPFSSVPTSVYVGQQKQVHQLNFMINGYFADAAETALLANDMFCFYKWDLPAAYLAKMAVRVKTLDSGAANTNINCTIGTADVLTSNSNAGLTVNTTWAESTTEISASNYDVAFGDTIEIKCDAAGTNDDARDLSVQLTFIVDEMEPLVNPVNSTTGVYTVWTNLGMPVYMTDTDTVTIADNTTASVYIKKGLPIKFVQDATPYYAIINNITDGGDTLTIELCGAPVTANLSAGSVYAAGPEKVKQLNFAVNGYFADAAETALLANDMFCFYKWDLPKAYLCKTSLRVKTIDSGAANSRVNITLGTTDVLTTNSNAGLTVASAWANNTTDISTTNYDVDFGDTVEIKVDDYSSNKDARDLSVQLNFVME